VYSRGKPIGILAMFAVLTMHIPGMPMNRQMFDRVHTSSTPHDGFILIITHILSILYKQYSVYNSAA